MRKMLGLLLLGAFACGAVEVTADFTRRVRPMKPMHGVGQPPALGLVDFQLFRYLKEAGIPYSRLHDVGSSAATLRAHTVDIPNVFPDFDADENDPANYDFLFTDKLLAALQSVHVQPAQGILRVQGVQRGVQAEARGRVPRERSRRLRARGGRRDGRRGGSRESNGDAEAARPRFRRAPRRFVHPHGCRSHVRGSSRA